MLHLGHVRTLIVVGLRYRKALPQRDDILRATWHAVNAVKAQAEKPIARAYASVLERQQAAVLSAWGRVGPGQVEAHGQSQDAAAKRAPEDVTLGDLVFDVGAWLSDMEGLSPLVRDALEEGFRTGALRIGQDLEFRMTARAEAELERVVGLIKDSSATTRDAVGGIVRRGLESGSSVDEIAAALRAQFADWQGWRAQLVAQTSATGTFEAGQQSAWMEAEIGYNRWLSQRDDRVRPEHDAMDGEEVPVGEAFSNGLEYPSEPNCRCTLLPVLKGEGKAAPAVTTWREERDARMRAHYDAVKGRFPTWVQAVEDVIERVEGAGDLAFETARKIVHRKG